MSSHSAIAVCTATDHLQGLSHLTLEGNLPGEACENSPFDFRRNQQLGACRWAPIVAGFQPLAK